VIRLVHQYDPGVELVPNSGRQTLAVRVDECDVMEACAFFRRSHTALTLDRVQPDMMMVLARAEESVAVSIPLPEDAKNDLDDASALDTVAQGEFVGIRAHLACRIGAHSVLLPHAGCGGALGRSRSTLRPCLAGRVGAKSAFRSRHMGNVR
jgi:hypothetical protein